MPKEDYAIVLDFLPRGYSDSYSDEPIAQALGEKYFTLLELVPRKGVNLLLQQKVYIGPDKRPEIERIKGRLLYDKLTHTARSELEKAIEGIIKGDEKRFVEFFNKAGPVTIRMHSLELLPGIGKKHMLQILEEREKKPFESFKDLEARVKLLPDPVKMIEDKIIEELEGKAKYYLFVRPVDRERRERPRRRF